jgi:MFS-type transporter involved in bile tolerance (Atg22 family)
MTFVFANLSIIFVGVAWLGEAYDFGATECGYILVTANVFGLIGCVLAGLILKEKYKIKCQILLVISFFAFGGMWFGFE